MESGEVSESDESPHLDFRYFVPGQAKLNKTCELSEASIGQCRQYIGVQI